jgi:hypothetical protein
MITTPGPIMVYNDPGNATAPDHSLRIIQDASEIPNINGILLETVDSGPAGATELVNASVDRKGAFRVDQLEVGAAADPKVLIPQCVDRLRELGIFLEGFQAFGPYNQ